MSMTMDDLRRILVDCAGKGEALGSAAEIADVEFAELGYDSLALLETAARLEQEFGVTISDDDVAELATPAQLLAAANALVSPQRTTHHSIVVNAPVAAVYAILADVAPAPTLFAAPVYYRHTERTESHERFRIWVLAGDQVASWTSVRRLDPQRHVITFEQEQSHPLVSSMRGEFRLVPRSDGSTEVLLDHEFVAVDAAAVAFVERATEANSTAQLAALRTLAELPLTELLFTMEDSVEVSGSAVDAYEFVHEARQWPNRLPHIAAVDVREEADGVQYLTKNVLGPDGAEHASTSVRLCFPHERIVFKQTTPAAPMRGNAGEWTFTPTATGCTITVRHTVLLDPDASRERVRAAVADSGRRTLLAARDFAQQRASA